jgi:hypothetical protein
MMNIVQLKEELNFIVNKALGSGLTKTQIATALTNAATATTALAATVTHDRTITDPGATLNPSQP